MFAVRNGKKPSYLNPPIGSEDEYESHIVVDVSAEIATVGLLSIMRYIHTSLMHGRFWRSTMTSSSTPCGQATQCKSATRS